ncbi:hypothetical protein B0H14DRAFT_2585553 [Mycena olivaceomarginata]|nr:hypothetical protein B0H14DRAFT_2585553 [Mycena olivaceomarginata]
MPEARESEASYQLARDTLIDLLNSDACLRVEHIEIDASESEANRFKKDHPARNGLPYQIDSSCTAKHGINHAQGFIFPPMWRTTGRQKSAHNISELVLRGLDYTYCSLILDLGPLFLMIQWLTHASGHFYSREEWETTIKLTDKKVQKNHVGLALVFKDHVFAFLTSDLVFQPTWRTTRAALPPSPPDFCDPEWAFLESLAGWIRHRAESDDVDQNGLTCNVIRGESTVFLGISVYTVNELFFLAGLSPLLTEAEVFLNPSRTARFTGAYLEFLNRSRTGLKALLKPAIKNGYLAPTIEQRPKYQDWLHVYAKDRARLPPRIAALVDLYLLFPFRTILDISSTGDILKPDLMDQPTFMRPEHYIPLLLEPNEMRAKSRPHLTVRYLVRLQVKLANISFSPTLSQGPCNVAIGPLEYCGNGHLVHIGSAAVAVPCYGAPSLSGYYAIRDLKTRALPPVIRGARRPEMTDSIAKELGIQKAGYDKALSWKRACEGDSPMLEQLSTWKKVVPAQPPPLVTGGKQLSTWKKVVPAQPPPLVAGGSKWVIIRMVDGGRIVSGCQRSSLPGKKLSLPNHRHLWQVGSKWVIMWMADGRRIKKIDCCWGC